MSFRIFHIFAILALITSAVYAYTIKYETLKHVEQVARLKSQIYREQDTIAVYKAEWQRLNSPDRIQILSNKLLTLQPLGAQQIVKIDDIPMQRERTDEIGRKLELLGVLSPTDTPATKNVAAVTTKSSRTNTPVSASARNIAASTTKSKPTAQVPEYTGSLKASPTRANGQILPPAIVPSTSPNRVTNTIQDKPYQPSASVYDPASR